ncbi:MAG: O-antigen polymerase [Bacteroidetes bacterium OLB10]|nr:MAG: O-antigen polymerase [Bacteroidetes bacterium OLB10]
MKTKTILILQKKEYNSTTLRIPLWINAYQVIENNPFTGVGTGDSRAELDSVFLKNKFQYAYQNHFDPHNQYLQTGVILGLAGLTLLLTMFLVPLYYSIRYRHYQFICLLIIFMFNMLTESIFERQAGIMFFSFFYSLFSVQIIEEMKKQQLPATE